MSLMKILRKSDIQSRAIQNPMKLSGAEFMETKEILVSENCEGFA